MAGGVFMDCLLGRFLGKKRRAGMTSRGQSPARSIGMIERACGCCQGGDGDTPVIGGGLVRLRSRARYYWTRRADLRPVGVRPVLGVRVLEVLPLVALRQTQRGPRDCFVWCVYPFQQRPRWARSVSLALTFCHIGCFTMISPQFLPCPSGR